MTRHGIGKSLRHMTIAMLVMANQAFAQDAFRFADVQLDGSGVLTGAVAAPTGRPMSNAVVEVRYQGKTIAVATSSVDGQFAVSQVRPGVHEVVVGTHAQPVRIWAYGTAPPQCSQSCQIRINSPGPVANPVSNSQFVPQPDPQFGNSYVPNQSMSTMPTAGVSEYCPPLDCAAEGCNNIAGANCGPARPWGATILPVVVAGSSVAALVLAIDARNAADDALAAAAVASP